MIQFLFGTAHFDRLYGMAWFVGWVLSVFFALYVLPLAYRRLWKGEER